MIKVKDGQFNNVSINTTINLPGIWIRLQLFDNDVEIFSARGKSSVMCSSVVLHHSEDAPPKPVGGKDDKKGAAAAAAAAAVTAVPSAAKHKYVLQAMVDYHESSRQTLLTALSGVEVRPNSRGGQKALTSSAKKKKPIPTTTPTTGQPTTPVSTTAPTGPAEPECVWHLRFVSTDTASLAVAKDTEKEDRLKLIKDSWEANAPGRMARARELRETYLRSMEGGTIKPVTIDVGSSTTLKPWTILKTGSTKVTITAEKEKEDRQKRTGSIVNGGLADTGLGEFKEIPKSISVFFLKAVPDIPLLPTPPHVVSQQESEQMLQHRKSLVSHSEELMSILRKLRSERREQRSATRKALIELVEAKVKEIEEMGKIDVPRRDAYKARTVKEYEEYLAKVKAIQDAILRAAELAAEQVAGDEPVDKKKKGGKK